MFDDASLERNPSEQQSRRHWLALVKPPKPISEMTEDELDAFADALFERMRGGYERVVTENAARADPDWQD